MRQVLLKMVPKVVRVKYKGWPDRALLTRKLSADDVLWRKGVYIV